MINKSISRSIAQLTRTIAQHNMPKAGMPRIACVLGFAILTVLSSSHAGPQGGQIRGGSGGIHQSGLNTTITQHSNALAIDWQGFDINSNESVRFIQPGSSAIALNRVLSNNASHIRGRLDANGHIVLVNPHGVFFGENATVNVGGLIASGLDINPNDFLNGDYVFSALEGSEGTVANYGLINAATGGSVSLLGRQVINDGMISARLGQVNLAAGNEVILTFEQGGLLGLKVSKAILQDELGVDPAVLNSGDIQAEGGQILLSGSVSQDLFSQALNMGDEQARSVVVHDDGSFTLGGGADVVNTGRLDASSMQGDAGDVIVLGENVTHEGVINASAINGNGGEVELHAADTTLLLGNAVVDASAVSAGTGGLVKLLGEKVGLLEQTLVDVSGALGGGTVLVGGDYTGANPLIRNARRTVVESGVVLQADALHQGDGGRLIHWGNEATWFYGTATVRGGEFDGNGGFIEISGNTLDYLGQVDASAPNGSLGTVLFDPQHIRITNAGDTSGPFNGGITLLNDDAAPIDGTFNINETHLQSAVNGNANFVLRALDDIIIDDLADNSLDLNRTGGFLSFIADANNDGVGVFSMNAGDTINIIDSVQDDGDPSSLIITAGSSISLGNIITQGGHVIIDGMDTSGSVLATVAAGTITTSGGDISIGNGDAIDRGLVGTATYSSDNLVSAVGGIGGITIFGGLDTIGNTNQAGGNITVTSQGGDIQLNTLIADGGLAQGTDGGSGIGQPGLAGGAITLNALAGSVTLFDAISSTGSRGDYSTSNNNQRGQPGGMGGSVTITASSGITVAAINTAGGGGDGDNTEDRGEGADAGDIQLTANIIQVNGVLSANGGDGDGTNTNQSPAGPAGGGDGGAITITGNQITLNNDITVAGGAGQVSPDADGSNGSVSVVLNGAGGGVSIGRDTDFTSIVNVLVDGGATGEQSLTAANRINNWLINDASSGSLNSGNISFTGIDNLVGNSNSDTLTISSSATSPLSINQGANLLSGFDFSILNFEGLLGTGDDIFNMSGFANNFTINAGPNLVAGSNLSVFGFNDLIGNGVNHSLIGENNSNTWRLLTTGFSVDAISFDGFTTLIGGTDNDGFIIEVNFTGELFGGEGADSFNISATNLNVGRIDGGNDAANNIDELIILHAGDSDWTIGDNLDATVLRDEYLSDTGGVNSILFTGVERLRGGTGADEFDIADIETTDVIDILGGGSTNDVLDISSIATALNISISGNVLTGIGDPSDLTYAGIENVLDSSMNHTLVGDNAGSTWRIDTALGAGFNDVDGLGFNGFGTLQGGDGGDTFNLSTSFAGDIDGGAGADTFNILAANVDTTLRGGDAGDVLNAFNINNTWRIRFAENSDGNAATNDDRLYNTADANCPVGPGCQDVVFSGIETVNGGTLDDIFAVGNGGAGSSDVANFTGDAALGVNTGTDRLDLTSALGTLTVSLDPSSPTADFAVASFESLQGNNNHTLAGDNSGNTWTIAGTGNDVDGVGFSGFGTLQGGDGGDTFNLSTSFAGDIDGGAGADTFNILAANVDTTLRGGDAGDVLNAFNINNTWRIRFAENSDGNAATNDDRLYNTADANCPTGPGCQDVVFSGIETVNGGTLDDIFAVGNGGAGSSDVANFTGDAALGVNTGTDRLDLTSALGALTVSLDPSSPTADFTVASFESLQGNNNHTLAGDNSGNTWTIAGTGNDVDGVGFSGFGTLQGGDGGDTFNLSTSFAGDIDGGAGADTFNILAANVDTTLRGGDAGDVLNAFNINNTWRIRFAENSDGNTATNDDRLYNTADANCPAGPGCQDVVFSGIETVNGGTLDDIFAVGNGGAGSSDVANFTGDAALGVNTGTDRLDLTSALGALTVSLDPSSPTADFTVASFESLQGNNNHTLAGDNSGNTWTIAGTGNDVDGVGFSGFGTLQGGDGGDTFNLSTSFAGDIDGGAGADTFNILAANVDTTLRGGDAGDVLNAFNINNTWRIRFAENSDGNTATNDDRLYNTADANCPAGPGCQDVVFSGIETVNGGTLDDIFAVGNGGAGSSDVANFTGDAALGVNTGTDRLDLTSALGALTVSLDPSSPTADFAVASFESLQGNNNHTLAGDNSGNTWTIAGTGNDVDGVSFSGFGTLQGGNGIDTFDINVSAGVLNGGNGADVFNILAPGIDVTIDGGDSPTGTFDKINAFDIANTWFVRDNGSHSISNMQGINTHTIGFSGVESLTGGIDVDIFNLGLALAGVIDGDDGSDQFNIQVTNANFTIDGGVDVGGGDSDRLATTYNDSNFNSQWILGAAATDTLNIRLNSDNSVQASATFSNIENLQGNTQADSFVIQNNFSTSVANVNGGAGADNILDLSQFAATVTVDLTSSIAVNGITANAVNTFVGNPAVNHTLRGQNDGDVWTFVASGFDNIDSSFNFSGFTTLQGGTGNDTFNFQTGAVIANNIVVNAGQGNDIFSVNNGATVNGTLNGGDAVTGDRLEIIGFQNDIVVDLGGNNNLGLNASDIETFSVINLAAGRSATLTGSDNGNFWVVNSALAFNSVQDFGANLMLDASDRIIQFAGFNILTGGDGADTFDVDTGFTGDLNGGAGMDLFDIAAGVNVDGDIGGDGGNDIVRLGNTASVTGSIDGGGGIDDQLDVSAFINPITVDLRVAPPLPLPANTFSATGIEVYVANPIPSNTLIADNVANDWTIDGIGAFEQVGSVSFSGFSILQGGTLRDRFFISTGFDGTINANDGNDEFNLSENITITGNLNGQDGDDIFRLDDGVSAAAINGGNDNDEIDLTNLATATTLNLNNGSVTGLTITSSEIERYTANAGIVGNTIVGANFDNTWVVDGGVFESVTDSRGTPGDTSDDIQTEFRGFTVLQGGNAEDTFSVDANFTGDINGGLDNDVFNIANNVTINGNIRGGGDSDLLNVSAFLSPITIDLAGGNNQGIGFAATEFEEFMANAAVAGNQIIAANSTNDWILATGAGVLDELIDRQGPGALDDLVVGFSGFDTLTGGSGVDSFSIERDFVQGAINGGLGNDNFTIINGVNVTAVLDGGDTGVGVLNTLNITQLTNDITVELDGVSEAASTSINVARLQQISANNDAARNNTIIGDNVVNSWVLANNRSGSVDHATDGRLDFSGFRQLQGGNSQDTFFANIASNNDFFINGGSQGAQQEDAINTVFLGSSGGVNLETMQLSNGIGFADIERFIGTPTGQTLTAENAVNVWTINPGNTGTISNPTSNISFSGFATLNGGSLIDTFNLNGAGAFAGTINAGDGNDVLTVAIDGSQTGNLRFNGDLGGADRIELSGGGPGITEVYTSNVGGSNVEQLTYTSGVNNFAVSYDGSSTEIINDNVQVDSLQVNGSAGSDTVLLGNGDFTVGSATPVGFNNKQNLIFNGGINDSLIINGPVSLLNGNLRINDFNISQTVTDRINVDQLILDASVVNGTLFTAIDAISILSASGAVDINELDAIELAGISTADAFTLNAAGRVNDTGQLSVQGDLLIDSGNGDIVLSQNNNLQGLVSLSSSGRVTVNNSVDINLGNVNVSDLTLTSGGGIIGSAAVAAGNAVLSATNDIVLSGSNINLNSLTISNAANANISNSSALLLTDANVSGALTLNSNGLNVSGPVNAGSNIAFDAGNGALQLDGLLDSNTGEIALVAADIIQNADITAANDVSLTSSSAINMASASVASSAQGDVRYVADGNIAVATLRAENGTAVASSTNGSIDDANGDTVNFVGERVEINAGSGVGVADNIETSAALLSVVNASGQINIDNTGDVELERLQTVGDIEFNNDLDIILQAGSVNGRFDVGDIILTSAQGSLSAAPGPRPSLANAHITGDIAIIALPFGTFNGVDIVANVNELFINALISVGTPETNLGAVVNDSSQQQLDILDILSSLTAEQSVEIESLADVNLLVFEGGDNYLADDIPISMPCDQREDYEYDDCE